MFRFSDVNVGIEEKMRITENIIMFGKEINDLENERE